MVVERGGGAVSKQADGFQFKDPKHKQDLVFKVVPIDSLEVVAHQRKPSSYHVTHLISSIRRVGFIVPLVVVERNGRYVILDGQHRFLAAQKLELKELPVIVVPERLANLMMNFNIEKELNIREKSFVALNIYRQYLAEKPQLLETDPLLTDSIEQAYYVTLGIGYEKDEKLRGGTLESIMKKCDYFLQKPLQEGLKERERRAQRVLQLNSMMTEIAQKLKEMDKWHPFVFQQILSFANPYKRKREIIKFDDMFDTLIQNLEKVKENPEIILKEEIEETS
jgi:ParB family chromosome partitioning protein